MWHMASENILCAPLTLTRFITTHHLQVLLTRVRCWLINLRVRFQSVAKFVGHGNRNHSFAFAMHARHLLFSACYKFFQVTGASPVFEQHVDPIQLERSKSHSNNQLVERGEFGKVLAGNSGRDERKSVPETIEHSRRV